MFRPINSDDHTRFRPPAEHVRQADATHSGQKRDFAYEVEQINQHKQHKRDSHEQPFGEDTFERTDSQPEHEPPDESPSTRQQSDNKPPEGHVDVQA